LRSLTDSASKRFIDGIPWSLQTTFFPMEFITKGATRLLMATDIEGGTVRYLADTLDIRQVGYRDWITARNPDKNEQEFFGLAHDATVFVIFRTGFDQTETPMRVTVTIFPVDRNQFIVDSGKVPSPQYGPEADSDSS
jgi:GntR family transcriptional regulator